MDDKVSQGKLRAINFDLSIHALEEHYSQTNPKAAYLELKRFFQKNGFEHRQWSGYRSLKKMSDAEVLHIMDTLYTKFKWLDKCTTHMDITNIESVYDIQKMRAEQIESKLLQKDTPKKIKKKKSKIK